MIRPVLLDLFCGAGGAAAGYHRAGFDVIGVDINPQPRYPFRFIQADAIAFAADFDWSQVAAVHASPPCQAYSAGRTRSAGRREHPELIDPTRELLDASGLPYVMENVEGAPLINPMMLCGAAFGLDALCHDGRRRPLKRHRLFETNFWFMALPCACTSAEKIGVYGNGGMCTPRHNGRSKGYQGSKAERARAMGIDWMTRAELNQAIPPAYTHFVGEHLLANLTTAGRSR